MSQFPFNIPNYQNNRKLFCLEVNPPRGISSEEVFSRLDKYLGKIDFLNVTDSALARMRMNPIVFASKLKERYGIEAMVNLSCRDRNLIAMQGELLAAGSLGVNHIIALTGDAISVGDNKDCKGVFEVNSVGLLDTIKTLNAGKDLAGNELDGAPTIIPGCVVNPNVRNPGPELRKLEKKKLAGAQYALSQPVFDVDQAVGFFKAASEVGVPLFLGLLPFRKGRNALAFQNVPGIKISPDLIAMAEANPEADLGEFSFQLCREIAIACKDYVVGYHLICGPTPVAAMKLLKKLQECL